MEPDMSMALEAEGGATRIPIAPGPGKTEIGRGTGLVPSDRTVSRRHVYFQLAAAASEDSREGEAGPEVEVRVSFEVVGKNPVLVLTRGGAKKIFRRSEVGELGAGDRISLSLKNPFFFSLRRCGGVCGGVDRGVLDAILRREKRTMQRRKEKEEVKETEAERARLPRLEGETEGGDAGPDIRFQMPDVSQIDPVKEFGFLVRGHEFDHYPRKIREIKHWNWFLHEQRDGNSSDEEQDPDEATVRQKRGGRKMKRKGEDNNDEEWTGESGDEKIAVAEAASAKRPKYLTRSRDEKRQKPTSGTVKRKGSGAHGGRFEEGDEEDETLGGFIVDHDEEEEKEQEEEEKEEEEEEEEFEDGDDDDDE